MAFPRPSVTVLLTSVILLLSSTPSSAQSHDSNVMPSRTREKVKESFQVVKDTLTVIKDLRTVTEVLKGFTKFISLVPGIGGLVASIVNVALAFVPQENPLHELREEFAEVNRKLDSLSIQMSNLATDVEWFNYASVYSQDELRILNAWRKFNEFLKYSNLTKINEERLRLAEIFTNYYEYTGTESSVSNLYHYLTTSSTSLSGNLNELLKKKFKCDIREIGRYNVYFSSLLWRGMVLNQLYFRFIGLNSSGLEDKHSQMSIDVYRAQESAVVSCVNNYMQYMIDDVKEISNALVTHTNEKKVIAEKVKNTLDKKYYWYEWVVLVYDTEEDGYHTLYNLTKIPVGKVTVAVDYKVKVSEKDWIYNQFKGKIKKAAKKCVRGKSCKDIRIEKCQYTWRYEYPDDMNSMTTSPITIELKDYVRAIHIIYGSNFIELPASFYTYNCYRYYYVYMHYSRSLPVCEDNPCKNGGKCEQMLNTDETLCKCEGVYYGQRCELSIHSIKASMTNVNSGVSLRVPDITTIYTQLEQILKIINNIARA